MQKYFVTWNRLGRRVQMLRPQSFGGEHPGVKLSVQLRGRQEQAEATAEQGRYYTYITVRGARFGLARQGRKDVACVS